MAGYCCCHLANGAPSERSAEQVSRNCRPLRGPGPVTMRACEVQALVEAPWPRTLFSHPLMAPVALAGLSEQIPAQMSAQIPAMCLAEGAGDCAILFVICGKSSVIMCLPCQHACIALRAGFSILSLAQQAIGHPGGSVSTASNTCSIEVQEILRHLKTMQP